MSALDELKLLTAWDTEPTLTEAELNSALAKAALPDAADLTKVIRETLAASAFEGGQDV